MDTPVGPDGWPAVFEDGTWHSRDGSLYWNGVAWMPALQKSTTGSWLLRIGAGIVLVALLAYAVYTTITSNSEFAIGYYVGLTIFVVLLVALYRYAGRWGSFGILVRGVCFVLAALKVLTLVLHPPPT